MKIIVLLHRFVCATAALLLSSGAVADGVRLSEWRHYAPLHDFPAGQSLSQTVVTNNQELGLFQRGFAGESDEGIVAALFNPAVLVIAAGGVLAVIALKNDGGETPDTGANGANGGNGNGNGNGGNGNGGSVAVMCGDADMPANRVFTEPGGKFRFLNLVSVDSKGPTVALTNSIVNWGVLSGAGWAVSISDDDGTYTDGTDDRSLPVQGIGMASKELSKGVTIYLSTFPSGEAPVVKHTLYTYEDSQMTLFAAAGGAEAGRKCDLAAGEFFLNMNNVRTTMYADSNQFRERLRGVLSEGAAVRLGNFYFTGDENFSNIRLERRDDLWLSEEFDVYSALGYQKTAADNTAVFYNQLTALRHLSADTDGYLQISSGSVTSDKYRDSQLRGLAVGFIADKVLSHDNILHFRLERPLGNARAKSWYAAADVQMGNAAKYWSLNLRHNLDTAQIEGGIYYRREF